MMTITEKAAYLKGLVEGSDLDQDKKVTKIINAIVDVIDDLAISVADAEDEIAAVYDALEEMDEHIDAVDSDLAEVEEILYEEDEDFCDCCCDECEDDCFDDEEYDDVYEVECPECGTAFCFDESAFESDEPLTCPDCGYVIEEIELEDEDED